MWSEKYYIVRKVKGKELMYTLDQWGRTDWTKTLSLAKKFDTFQEAQKVMYNVNFFTGYDLEVRKTDNLNTAYNRAMQGV